MLSKYSLQYIVKALVVGAISIIVLILFLFSHTADAQKIPAGCPGGPAGPAAPGVVCPGESTPRTSKGGGGELTLADREKGYRDVCGKNNSVKIKFNFGCTGTMSNPIYDLAFAIIRFLSAGVGVVVVIAIILAGIKYSTSEGNPEATMQAKKNIQSAIIALIIYIFIFAIVNYLVPGGFLR